MEGIGEVTRLCAATGIQDFYFAGHGQTGFCRVQIECSFANYFPKSLALTSKNLTTRYSILLVPTLMPPRLILDSIRLIATRSFPREEDSVDTVLSSSPDAGKNSIGPKGLWP
jgi:hypothetical protein